MKKSGMKKLILTGFILLAALSLAACASNSSEEAARISSAKKAHEIIPTTPDKTWFYNEDKGVYYAGDMTLTFGKTEVMTGSGAAGTKILVVNAKVRNNNNKEEISPLFFYTILNAKQKVDGSNVKLNIGVIDYDINKGNPYKQQDENRDNDLLPGKTVDVMLVWELQNDSPVTIEMSDQYRQTTIATKEIEVK